MRGSPSSLILMWLDVALLEAAHRLVLYDVDFRRRLPFAWLMDFILLGSIQPSNESSRLPYEKC